MRTVYHEKLSELSEQLGRMCGLAGAAMERGRDNLIWPREGGLKWPHL